MSLEIRALTAADTDAFWQLRLQALERNPHAFGESVQEHLAIPMETFTARLADVRDDNFVLGAFVDGQLVGNAGFARIQRVKRRHTGIIWGMYVSDAQRGKRIGHALLAALLERVRALPDLEQIRLSATANQAAAQRLYASAGFETFGREPGALRVGDELIDEDHMILRLKTPAR
jgi:RimJ/RimL family protein N-acetyltransferase